MATAQDSQPKHKLIIYKEDDILKESDLIIYDSSTGAIFEVEFSGEIPWKASETEKSSYRPVFGALGPVEGYILMNTPVEHGESEFPLMLHGTRTPDRVKNGCMAYSGSMIMTTNLRHIIPQHEKGFNGLADICKEAQDSHHIKETINFGVVNLRLLDSGQQVQLVNQEYQKLFNLV